MREIIIALASGLMGSLIGGLIAIYGSIIAVRMAEYYRLRALVKRAIENTISKVSQHNHPQLLLGDPTLNSYIEDILLVMPYCKRRGFCQQWDKCRHDKETYDLTPREYEESTRTGRTLITERFHNLISKL